MRPGLDGLGNADDDNEEENETGSAKAICIVNSRGNESVDPPGDINSDHGSLFSSDNDHEVEVVEVDIRFADVYARGHSSLQQYLQ